MMQKQIPEIFEGGRFALFEKAGSLTGFWSDLEGRKSE